MEHNMADDLLKVIHHLRSRSDAKRLKLDNLERVIKRLGIFSKDCEDCKEYLEEMNGQLQHIQFVGEILGHSQLKEHQKTVGHITAHLQKKHKLIPNGYYMSVFMSIGISLGLVFGLTLFDSPAQGLPIGMGIGIAVGVGLDADAKKKGKTI